MLIEMVASVANVTGGVPTEGGGSVRLVIYDPVACPKNSDVLNRFHRIFPDRDRVDHRILAACLLLMQHNAAPVVLVTKDLNMHLKARAAGIECQDYLSDKVDAAEIANYALRQIDNPYVDSRSNGLVYTRNRLKGQAFAAHIALNRGERSELAEAGAQLM